MATNEQVLIERVFKLEKTNLEQVQAIKDLRERLGMIVFQQEKILKILQGVMEVVQALHPEVQVDWSAETPKEGLEANLEKQFGEIETPWMAGMKGK